MKLEAKRFEFRTTRITRAFVSTIKTRQPPCMKTPRPPLPSRPTSPRPSPRDLPPNPISPRPLIGIDRLARHEATIKPVLFFYCVFFTRRLLIRNTCKRFLPNRFLRSTIRPTTYEICRKSTGARMRAPNFILPRF